MPRSATPPPSELFLEMGIIVKLRLVPFLPQPVLPRPPGRADPETPGHSGRDWKGPSPGQDGLGAIRKVIFPLKSADHPHSPGEDTEAQKGQVT